MEAFTSWNEYDVVILEAHGEHIKDDDGNYIYSKMQIAESVDYIIFRNYIQNSPYFKRSPFTSLRYKHFYCNQQ